MAGGETSRQLVELREVVKTYPTPTGLFYALRGVDLRVDAGEFVAVIGKSGSGKSTLINAIAGIDRPSSGSIHIAGTAVHQLDENSMASWRGQNLGVIFQFFQLLPTLTLAENVMLPMEFALRRNGLGRNGSGRTERPQRRLKARRVRALELLERVDMAAQADKLPSQVSGGQQQRVAIARSLANDPALIVADEPTGSLDSRTADTIFDLFEDLVASGKTILMVTHDSDLAARASRVVMIVDGDVVESHIRTALPDISAASLVAVSAKLDPQVFTAGTDVFTQGDVADRFYIVVRGELEVIRKTSDGTEHVVSHLESGHHFGEIGLLTSARRNATVRARSHNDVSVVSIDAATFQRLVDDNQMTNQAIARSMRQRLESNAK